MISEGRPAVLFVPGPAPDASFVVADRAALAARVRVVEAVPHGGWRLAGFAAAVAWQIARQRPARAVIWFAAATYGSAVAASCRLAGVPWLVVSGGVDVAAMPDIGFGEARGGWRRVASRRVLEGASMVWAFSDSARREILLRASPRAMAIVPPAVDTAFFRPPAAAAPRERLVVSTCAAITPLTLVQKGLDRLVAGAGFAPEVQVVITGRLDAGAEVQRFVAGAPANVAFAGHVDRDTLRALYRRAAAVAQLSRHEGFGVAAAEGLAMGCAVLTSALPAFDEVVGGPGHHRLDDDSPAAIAAALRAVAVGPPGPSRWAEVDRRYGGAVRAAAWDRWLAGEGLMASRP